MAVIIENALLTYQTGRAQVVLLGAQECRRVFAAHVGWIEQWKDSTTERIQAWKDLKDTFSTILKTAAERSAVIDDPDGLRDSD